MLTEILLLIIFGFIFIWSTAWIRYFNNLDERLGNSIWRWSYDYPVKGKRDISNLDDKEFVLLRRKRNKAVTLMWWIFFILFIILMSFMIPSLGAGMSMEALSDSTVISGVSYSILSPTFTNTSITSTLSKSPISGIRICSELILIKIPD